MSPTGEEITKAIEALQLQSPNTGRKKLVVQLNTEKGWNLTNKDIKEHQPQRSESGPQPLSDKIEDCKETSAPKLKGNDRKANKNVSKKDVDVPTNKDNDKPEMEIESSQDGIPKADTPQQKCNCFLIRAEPRSATPLQNITSQVEPFNLSSYGDEMGEMRELKTRLGWKNAREVGKFYDHKGTDSWYYYVYGEEGSSRPKNEAASLVCYKKMKGDIAVIRSGPAGTDTPEYFTQKELSEAVEFYKTHDRSKIFTEREKSRISHSMGMNLEGVPHLYVNETSAGYSYSY